MEKIRLTKNAKRILRILNKSEDLIISETDEKDLYLLEQEELIELDGYKNGQPFPEITRKGISYILMNPTLSNPSIWDDKKYWITTGISVLAFLLSVIALYFEIKYHIYGNC